MTVWEELKARGLIAQVTDEDEIKEMVNNGKATFYIGFDPTAILIASRNRCLVLLIFLTERH
jgi:tyrosyl-tRNA synthetase